MPLASQRPVRNRIGLEHQAADLPLSNRPVRATQGGRESIAGIADAVQQMVSPLLVEVDQVTGDTVWHLCVLKRNGLCMKCRTVAPDDPCPSSFVAVDDEATPEMKTEVVRIVSSMPGEPLLPGAPGSGTYLLTLVSSVICYRRIFGTYWNQTKLMTSHCHACT